MIMLATPSEVKEFLEITLTTFDSLIQSIVERVSARIELYLNRDLEKEERTEYFSANRRNIYLPAYPIDTACTFTLVLDNVTQTVDDDYYLWGEEGRIEWYKDPAYIEPKQIKITWTGGYNASTTTFNSEVIEVFSNLPLDITDACIMQSAYIFRRRRDLGVSRITMPDGSIQTFQNVQPSGLLPEVEKSLNRHRKTASEK